MLDLLYPLGYLASLLGLIMWFYFKEQPERSRLMSKVFLGGFFIYLFSLAFANGALNYKLLILFRDLVILGLVSQFFNFLRKNTLLFFAVLAILLAAFRLFGYKKMMQTFPQPTAIVSSIANSGTALAEDGELLVDLSETGKKETLQQLSEQFNFSFTRAFFPEDEAATELDDYFVIDLNSGADRQAIMDALMNSGLVDYVEENETIKLDPMEMEPASVTLRDFGINDPEVKQLWGFEKMKVDQLYADLAKAKIKPKRKARVFILDTGIDAQHEDIKANYRSHKRSYDTDTQSHGTHCAGIAAAVSNNGLGIASFSKDNSLVEVTSVRVLNGFGGGTQQGIIKGMLEAADAGADVISMSLGGPGNRQKQQAYKKAVDYANKKGAIVVVAAGNSNRDAKDYAPANVPGVITVAALNAELNRAQFSNSVNSLKMGVAAPGVGIYSTIPKNKYAAFNGTSMATPYVAGLLGVMKSIYPKLTTKEAYNILNKTGATTGDTKMTGRFIQPAAAVKELLD
ncbi:MAG: S8 family serine peptidase [Bacteroidota bacterium]